MKTRRVGSIRRIGLAAALTAVVAAGGVRPVLAQDVATARNDIHVPRALDVLSRRVSLRLDSVSRKQAINMIASVAKVRIQYQGSQLDAIPSMVTLHLSDVALGDALSRALAGTTLQAIPLAEDEVLIRTSTAAVSQGTLVGTVVNAKTKQPVRGATVFLDDATKGVQTDEGGAFRIPAAPGDHRISVRAVGFVRHSRQVVVRENDRTAVTIEVDPSASVLDEVVVTGTVVATQRREISTPITVITSEELEKRNITRIEQLFRGEVPGVLAIEMGPERWSSDGLAKAQTSRVFSRGSSTLDARYETPIKTYVDGVELLDPNYLGTIDPRSIDRIEIVTGPQAATIYGSGAMGGVMQIFTKKGSRSGKPDMTLNVRYGMLQNNQTTSFAPQHNHALILNGGNGADFSYSVTGTYGYTGQWQPGLWARNMGMSFGMTHTRGIFQVGASGSVTRAQNGSYGTSSTYQGYVYLGNGFAYSTLIGRAYQESGDLPVTFGTAGFFESIVAKSTSQNISLDFNVRPIPIWQNKLTVGRVYNKFNNDPERPTYKTPADSVYFRRWSEGARQSVNYSSTIAPQFGPMAASLSIGSTYSSGSQGSYVGCTAKLKDERDAVCPNYGVPLYRTGSLDDNSWGGFGLLQLGFFDRLFVKAGVRGERNPTYGSNYPIDWTPTSGIAYTIETGDLTLKLLASYGSATRAPRDYMIPARSTSNAYQVPFEVFYQLANPNLRPERSRGPQGGFELSYGNLGSLTLNRYDQRVDDLLMSLVVDSVYVYWLPPYGNPAGYSMQQSYLNVGAKRQHGWEMTGSINLGPVNVRGAYTMAEARATKVHPLGTILFNTVPGVGQTNGGAPSHYGNFGISYAHGPTSVTWTGNYVGSSVQSLTSIAQYLDPMLRLQMYRLRVKTWDTRGTTPGYLKHDLAASHRLTMRTSLLLNIQNLTDNNASDATPLLPSLGRQTQLGMSISLL